MENFWLSLPKPVVSLAPMEDVTDTVFREVILRLSEPGALHVVFTEFTSTDGLCHERGFKKVSERLKVNATEKEMLERLGVRIVAQIWGNKPDYFHRSASIITEMGCFDGIDINMGCPVRKIVKDGACSALILNPPLACEIISATKAGTSLPVSVKTRIGFQTTITEDWMNHLIEARPAAIILHARTSKEQSLVPARWDQIRIAVETRDAVGARIPIIGNGDVNSMNDGMQRCKETGADGFMVGRGVFHNPWMFRYHPYDPDPKERIEALLFHARKYMDTWGKVKSFQVLKRFFKIYATSFSGAAKLRAHLMEAHGLDEVENILRG